MQITIYKNFSKEVNSTKQPSGGTAVSCTLKEDTSLLHPVFILQGADFDVNYVSWGSRYYFVDDIVSIRNGVVELHCSVDPLASFKSTIGGSTQYVVRSSADVDPSVIDNYYPLLPRSTTDEIVASGIHSQINNDGCYVVGVLGSSSVNGITFYMLYPSQFADLMNALFTGNYLQAPVSEISLELQKEICNPMQYISSVYWFPFTPDIQASQSIKFGFWDSGVSGSPIDEATSLTIADFHETLNIPYHPQATSQNAGFLNNPPFTSVVAHVYSFGDIVLDPSKFRTTLTIQINVDMYTGVGYLRFINNEDEVIARSVAQIGVPMPLAQQNQNALQGALGVIAGVGSVMAGSPLGLVAGVGSAIDSIVPNVEKIGAYGSRIAFIDPPTLLITWHQRVDIDNQHHGKPLMQRRTISAIPGYIQAEKVDVDITGTPEEKGYIVRYMESGFYYE